MECCFKAKNCLYNKDDKLVGQKFNEENLFN